MRRISTPARGALVLAAALALPAGAHAQRIAYPASRALPHVDTLHGTAVPDPYRWLEDTDAPETRAWIEAQNAVTERYLAAVPEREKIRERLTRLWNFARQSTPWKQGGRYFFTRNDGLQAQSVYYVQERLDGPARAFLDPNTLSSDGTVAASLTAITEDGKRVVYSVSSGGSDWQEFRVRDVDTGRDLADTLKWIKFSGASWTHDGKGFFYSRYPEPTGNALTGTVRNQKLYYHRLGTPQSADVLVYEKPDHPDWFVRGGVTDDGRYLLINLSRGTDRKNAVFVQDLGDPMSPRLNGEVRPLFGDFDGQYGIIGNDGTTFYARTDIDAPMGRVIAASLERPGRAGWREVLPQGSEPLRGIGIIGGKLVASYLRDASTRIRIHEKDGRHVRDVELPGLGTGGMSGDEDDPEAFFSFSSYVQPGAIYRYDMRTGRSELFWEPKTEFDASKYVTRQVFYTSKDGTRVPMFITHRRDIQLDGTNPTLLYGYGGFNSPMLPGYSTANAVWLEMGGVYAVANIRGGSEYGDAWHQGGTLANKQNVFDDFIAAGEYLVKERITSPRKLAVMGGSNGGLLVGAVVNQRPDLFGAALPAVGVMDMLRFHKFTIGSAWISDYGSPDDPQMFPVLRAYSPYHNVQRGARYPAVLVTTGDHDDRVVPGHSFKYTAAMQAAQGGDAPVLIRVETRAGHGAGKPTAMQIEETADRFAFLVKNLGMRLPF